MFHEEHEHFDSFIDWAVKLPAFEADWQEHIIHPAFDENYFIAFERNPIVVENE